MERRGACPACGARVRFTAEDLADKRGFCAACDRGFEITPHTLEKRQALARAEVVELASQAPPTRSITVRPAPGAAVTIHVDRSASLLADYPVVALLPLVVGCILPVAWLPPYVWASIAIALGFGHAYSRRFRRETVEFLADAIVIRRETVAGRETWVPLNEVLEVYTKLEADSSVESHVVKIARKGQDPVVLCRGFGFSREAASWLENWVRAKSGIDE